MNFESIPNPLDSGHASYPPNGKIYTPNTYEITLLPEDLGDSQVDYGDYQVHKIIPESVLKNLRQE